MEINLITTWLTGKRLKTQLEKAMRLGQVLTVKANEITARGKITKVTMYNNNEVTFEGEDPDKFWGSVHDHIRKLWVAAKPNV